jgi:hypothetical protein
MMFLRLLGGAARAYLGDRYWSEILVGKPPPGAEAVDWGPAVIHVSSVAVSMPPHRGAVFKQRPKHNRRLCLFRAQSWVGRGWRRWPKRRSRRRKPTRLAWVSPRRAGGTVKVRFSCGHQNGPRSHLPARLTRPSHSGTSITDSLHTAIRHDNGRPQGRFVPYRDADFLNRSNIEFCYRYRKTVG